MYSFRFHVIENITRTSVRINRAFMGMRSGAKQFALGIGEGWREAVRLGRENRRLERSNRRAFNPSVVNRFGRSIGGVNGLVRQLRGLVAVVGVGALVHSATSFNDRMFTANALVAGITRSTEGLADAQAKALALSDQTGVSYLQAFEGMSKMLTVTRGNVQQAGELTKLAQALSATNPAEGFEGALFALKELESGDTMSLRERFNIRVPTRTEAKKIAERDGRSVQQVMFDSLQSYLDNTFGGGQSGQGVEFLLNIRANTIGGQMQRIANSFQNIFTPMLLPFLQRLTSFLRGIGDWVQANKDSIRDAFSGVIEFVVPIFETVKNLAIQLFPLLSMFFVELSANVHEVWPVVGSVLTNIIGTVQSIFPHILALGSTIMDFVRGLLPSVALLIGPILDLIETLIPPIVFIAKLALKILQPVVTIIVRLVAGLINGIVESVKGISEGIVQIGQDIFNAVVYMGELAVWAWENNPFRWIIDLVDRVFPGFKATLSGLWTWVKGLFTSLTKWIWENVLEPIGGWIISILESLGLLSPSTKSKASKPTSTTAKSSDADASADPNQKIFEQLAIAGGVSPTGTRRPGDIGLNKQIGGAVSGGREGTKNITIHIDKLIESLNFQTTNLTESKDVVRRELERQILDVLNNFNYAT